jgi:hypothetical protein
MGTTLTINGVGYTFPAVGDKPWAQDVINWATAITNGVLQKSGGAFALLADVDFGASYGVKSLHLSTRSANPASAGVFRLANGEAVSWRDNANAADLDLLVDASDNLTYGGDNLQPLTTDGDIIVRSGGDNVRLPKGANGLVLLMVAGAPAWGAVAGTGDVVGPGSATDTAIALFDGVTGKLIKESGVYLDAFDNLSGVNRVGQDWLPQTADTYSLGNGTYGWSECYLGTLKTEVTKALPPVGSIIPFYDFGTGGPGSSPLTFDAAYWAYCDGSNVALNGAGSYATPDLSNRYLVGFGTEGGGDMDSAAWATAAVGNASHQVDLQHSHTGPAHIHGPGTLLFAVAKYDYTSGSLDSRLQMYDSGGALQDILAMPDSTGSGGTNDGARRWGITAGTSDVIFYTAGGSGSTASSGTAGTGNSLSTTQSIQPRSIRVRYLMRIK